MALKNKTDYYALANALGALVIAGTADGRKASNAVATDQEGSVVASDQFGDILEPNCDYEVSGTVADSALIELGKINPIEQKSFVLSSVTITTAAGQAPTVSASGSDVGSATGTGVKNYAVTGIGLTARHVAQILFGWGSVTGEGAYLTGANYTVAADLSTATVNGSVVSFGVSNGRIEAALTISAPGGNLPVLSLTEGWKVLQPLAETNPDSDYPSYSATIVKYLAKVEASA